MDRAQHVPVLAGRVTALLAPALTADGAGSLPTGFGNGFAAGSTAISLRGLGPEATLVLIDGRRIAPYPVGNGGTSSFFDLRSIPEAAVESIEILKDGASTTYGADAVASRLADPAVHVVTLTVTEKAVPPGDPRLVPALNNLGVLHREMGHAALGEPLLREAVAMRRHIARVRRLRP